MGYVVHVSDQVESDLDDFIYAGDKKLLKKISTLYGSISETPRSGIGKPEPLRHDLSGLWSRRINKEHRMVYRIIE